MAKKTKPAVKKPVRPSKKKSAPKAPSLTVTIDYPLDCESVRPGHYAVRVTADGAESVQARVNDDDWSDCRESVGHYWLDWAPVPGPARLEARARRGKGKWASAAPRGCVVEA